MTGGVMGGGRDARRATRAQRSARNKQVWASANGQLQQEFRDAAPRLGATKEEQRAARAVRQQARARRDSQWRAEVSVPMAPGTAVLAPAGRRRPGPSPLQRQVLAIEGGVTATWQAGRATRAQRRQMNRSAWAQLQLDRLAALQATRTSRRGVRRQARSQAWLAAQAARIQAGQPATTTQPQRGRNRP